MIDGKKAQRGRTYPAITAIPNNYLDQSDINNAKACKMLLDNRSKSIMLDELHTELDEIIFTLGHGFMYIPWNRELGDPHPLLEKVKERYGGKLPASIKKKLGDKNMITVGDVEVIPVGADRVFVELNKERWEDIDYLFYTEKVHVEELRHLYPDINFSGGSDEKYLVSSSDIVIVKHFFHRKTRFLPEGKYIKFCYDGIMDEGPLPYDDGELPFVPDTDLTTYGEFWGDSFISRIEQLQRLYNLIYSGTARDYALSSAAKWFVQKGSVNKKDLSNDNAIVEFKGAFKPIKENASPVNTKSFEFQDRIESKISKGSGVYDI